MLIEKLDTSGFVENTDCNRGKTEIKNKIPDARDFVRKTSYGTNITEIGNKEINTAGQLVANLNNISN